MTEEGDIIVVARDSAVNTTQLFLKSVIFHYSVVSDMMGFQEQHPTQTLEGPGHTPGKKWQLC